MKKYLIKINACESEPKFNFITDVLDCENSEFFPSLEIIICFCNYLIKNNLFEKYLVSSDYNVITIDDICEKCTEEGVLDKIYNDAMVFIKLDNSSNMDTLIPSMISKYHFNKAVLKFIKKHFKNIMELLIDILFYIDEPFEITDIKLIFTRTLLPPRRDNKIFIVNRSFSAMIISIQKD